MADFGTIEKHIKQFKYLSFPELIFKRLLDIEKNHQYFYPFWRLLVILKWSFVYSEKNRFRRKANFHDLDKLIKLTEEFESGYDVISFESPQKVKQFFRILAYQQFPFQDHYTDSIIDRQLVLYFGLGGGLNISEEFEKLTNMKLVDFFNYLYLTNLYIHFDELKGTIAYNGKLNSDFFDYFCNKFSDEELQKFLNLLSIRDKSDFDRLHFHNSEILQLYETNIFIHKPFIFFDREYRIPHRALFLQSLSFFVYTFLKKNITAFPETFGNRLEKYVELGLEEAKVKYLNETELKKKYSSTKVTDFFIKSNTLIEVKATELHPRSGTSRISSMLKSDLKSSVIKAYKQLLSTAAVIDSKQTWFGVIITYREMYLGFGPDAWEEFLREPMEAFATAANIDMKILPPENIFFISISDWDWIVQVLKDDQILSLEDLLKKARDCNGSSDPLEQVFMMEQVLRKFYQVKQFNLSYHRQVHGMIDVLTKDSDPNTSYNQM